jgi:hypothetical protein
MSSTVNAEWYFARNGVQSGPFEFSVMRAKIAAGEIQPNDLVWREGMAAWTPLSDVAELRSATATPTPSGFPASSVAANFDPQTGNVSQPAHAPLSAAPQQPFAGQQGYAAATLMPDYSSPIPTGPSQQGMAVAGLVMAVIPIFPLPLLGLIFSMIALKGMKKSGNFEGKGLATAGAIVGGILTGLVCVVFLVWIVMFAVIAGAAASGAGH